MSETLLKYLCRRRHLTTLAKFNALYSRTARQLQLGDRTVSQRTLERWLAGDLKKAPQPEAREVMFGEPVGRLFSKGDHDAPTSTFDTVIDLTVLPATPAWNRSQAGTAESGS